MCWENVTIERTSWLSSHSVPARAKCRTSMAAGRPRLIWNWVYRPARARLSTSGEMSVATTLTARSGAASNIAMAMLYGSWPVAQPADHTRNDVSPGRSRITAGMTSPVRARKGLMSRNHEVSFVVSASTMRSCSAQSGTIRRVCTYSSTPVRPA